MKRIYTYSLTAILFLALGLVVLQPAKSYAQQESMDSLYAQLGLAGRIDLDVFKTALQGMNEYSFVNDSILSIIDYTKASHRERLFVIDLKNEKLLFTTLVAHGKNSGIHYATRFSNKNRSLMSSPGFYRTAETYFGKHGYSLKLDGLEEGVNDHARERLIVIHGADYVSSDFIKKHGRIGRSWGCPALPLHLTKEVIDLIKDGSCLFIYTKDEIELEQFAR